VTGMATAFFMGLRLGASFDGRFPYS